MRKPAVLVLDFGGVITRTLFETHAQTEAALGLASDTLTWRGPFAPQDDALWRSMQADEISERDYWLARTREVGRLAGEEWSAMETFVRRVRGADPDSVIRPEAKSTTSIARAAGVRLAILSNELDLFYGADLRRRLPLLAQFEHIEDATHTGVLKPDPRAYAAVVKALDVKPSDCVFVDDQARNATGARHAGMRAVDFDVRDPRASFNEALAPFGLSLPPVDTGSERNVHA